MPSLPVILTTNQKTHAWLNSFTPQNIRWIKESKSTKAGILTVKNQKFFVKEYRYNKPWGLLKYRARPKGKNIWNITCQLKSQGIDLPQPIAYVYNQQPHTLNEYIISELLPNAIDLRALEKKQLKTFIEVQRISNKAALLIFKIHQQGIVHGDFKWANLMFSQYPRHSQLQVVDFDGCYKSNKNKEHVKDLARFLVNMQEAGLAQEELNLFISTYATASNSKIEKLTQQIKPYFNKILSRHKQQYPQRFTNTESSK